eukprot:scaffold1146_cov339-Pavlova_lutheri.AAC.5
MGVMSVEVAVGAVLEPSAIGAAYALLANARCSPRLRSIVATRIPSHVDRDSERYLTGREIQWDASRPLPFLEEPSDTFGDCGETESLSLSGSMG